MKQLLRAGLLRSLLIRMLLVSLLPLFFAAAFLTYNQNQSIADRFEEDSRYVGQATARSIDDRINLATKSARLVAAFKPTQAIIATGDAASIAGFLFELRAREGLDSAVYADTNGVLIAGSPDPKPGELAVPDLLKSVRQGVQRPWKIEEEAGGLRIYALTPVAQDSVRIGLIQVGVNLDKTFLQAVVQTLNLSKTSDGLQLALVANDKLQATTSPETTAAIFPSAKDIERAPDQRIITTVSSGGKSYYAIFTAVQSNIGAPPVLGTFISREPLEAAQQASYRILGILIVGLSLLILAIAYFTGTRISRPIVALAGAARKVAGGELSTRVAGRSRYEVGQLERTFDSMAESLEQREQEQRRSAQQNLLLRTILQDANLVTQGEKDIRAEALHVFEHAAEQISQLFPDSSTALSFVEEGATAHSRVTDDTSSPLLFKAVAASKITPEAATVVINNVSPALQVSSTDIVSRKLDAGGMSFHLPILAGEEIAGALSLFLPKDSVLSEPDTAWLHSLVGVLASAKKNFDDTALLRAQALNDHLTGLPNRRSFEKDVLRAMSLARRRSESLAIFSMDVNKFKFVNDTYGHDAGDELLTKLEPRYRLRLRDSDIVARFGGDEFAVLLADVGTPENAFKVASAIQEAIKAPFEISKAEGNPVYVGTSIGISIFPEMGDDFNLLMHRADFAQGLAKLAGEPKLWEPSMEGDAGSVASDLIAEMKSGIAKNEFFFVYQPVVDLTTGATVSVEASLRWAHPKLGTVLPERFLTDAERSKLLLPLALWGVAEAGKQMQLWDAAGFTINVSINLSPKTLMEPTAATDLLTAISDSGLPTSRFIFEIQEEALSSNLVLATSQQIALSGATLLVDNFGAGTSSLVQVRKYPTRSFKLAKQLTGAVASDENAKATVRALLGFTKALDEQLIAKGVEDVQTLAAVRDLGVRYGQGFLLGKGLKGPEVPELTAQIVKNLSNI